MLLLINSFLFLSRNVSPTEALSTKCFPLFIRFSFTFPVFLVLNGYPVRPVVCKYLFPYRQTRLISQWGVTLGDGVPAGSPNPDPIFRPKMSFPHPFSEMPPKIHIRLPTWRTHKRNTRFPRKNFVIIPGAYNLKIYFEITYNSNSLSYSLGIETTNTFMHSRRSLENHARDSRPK